MAVNSIYRLSIESFGGTGNSDVVNVFHYKALDATIFDTQVEDLIQAWQAEVQSLYLALMCSNFALARLVVRGVTNPTEGADFSYSPVEAGTREATNLPNQNAALVLWKTGLIGRRFNGKSYLPPAGEGDNNQGVLVAGYQTSINNFAAAAIEMGDGITTARYGLVVHSVVGSADTIVTSHSIMTEFRTQRRRRAGVGS